MCGLTPILPMPSRISSMGPIFNSGQSCCGIERIYVHKKVWGDFIDGFVDLTRNYVLGSPLEEATTLGPHGESRGCRLRAQADRAAVRAGAKAHVDPRSFALDKAGTPYMAPQVLTDVNHRMSVMMEESFGPVVGIMKVADDAEAIELMNDSPYGLTAAIWTEDVAAAQSDRRRDCHRHGLHEPLRLSRSGADLDGRQGYGPRRYAVGCRIRSIDQTQELSPEDQNMTFPIATSITRRPSSSVRAASRSWPSSARPMAFIARSSSPTRDLRPCRWSRRSWPT